MEVETKTETVALGWRRGQQPLSPRSSALTPAEDERMARSAEVMAACERRMAEEDSEEKGDEEEDEMVADFYAFQASKFRDSWESQWLGYFGSFEDTTRIPCMRFTEKKPEPQHSAFLNTTLQIFSLKVAGIRGSLQWPLHIFGTVFLRDSLDHNRNVIFDRRRDNCQILTQEAPCLTLTGPTRAVVLLDPVIFEVDLKAKGATESEDKHLSSLAVPFMGSTSLQSCLHTRDYTSKLSTLEFALGVLVYSLEATIKMRFAHGSWADGFRARIAARTTSIGHEEVILLDSGDGKVHVDGDGWITLSRQVASVEVDGELKVVVKACLGDEIIVAKEKGFTPKKSGTSDGTLDIGFCQIDITVAWSLISSV